MVRFFAKLAVIELTAKRFAPFVILPTKKKTLFAVNAGRVSTAKSFALTAVMKLKDYFVLLADKNTARPYPRNNRRIKNQAILYLEKFLTSVAVAF